MRARCCIKAESSVEIKVLWICGEEEMGTLLSLLLENNIGNRFSSTIYIAVPSY